MYLGLDIGGTKIIACSADDNSRIVRKIQVATPAELAEGLDLLNDLIETLREGQSVQAIGASLGGPLDYRSGIVSPLHQVHWREVPFREIMENRWGCRVTLDVDTNLAALGEYSAMPTKPKRLLYITLSTGMGGGFLIDGRIYRGADGAHPEIAHQSIPYRCRFPDRISCECGLQDCLEGIVSGNAIRRIYAKPAEALDPDEWSEVSYNLGHGLRNLAVILAPDVIVLGGGVAVGGGERLIAAAESVMQDHLRLVPHPKIALSRLGYYTSLHGAVYAAVHGLDE